MYGWRQVPPTWRPFHLIHRFAWKFQSPLAFDQSIKVFSQPELQPITRLLAEPGVCDLVINGHDYAAVLVGSSWRRVESDFSDAESLDSAARFLVAMGDGRLDLAHPFASVDIDGKYRVHALLASAVTPKTHISIRVHASRQVALAQLAQIKMISELQLNMLQTIMKNRESFIVSGAAGAGKTTLLRAMLGEVTTERIITIEDVPELQLNALGCVSLCSRQANVEGKGEITLQQLLVESLRMRPDRLVIGEVRSAEIITLLQAINTGHCASATIHANSAAKVRERIMGIALASGFDGHDIWQQFANSVDWAIHIQNRAGARTVDVRRLNE